MTTYKVEIIETLCRIVSVKAESSEEAYQKVREAYRQEKIVLTPDDFQDVTIELFTP